MARIRSIKPEFWTDPDIVAMPMAARLFLIGCWNHADDYGVLRDDPERLRLQIMPADPIDAVDIVDELVESKFLVRMIAPDGTALLVVRTFTIHQKIDKRAVGRWGHPDDFTPAESHRSTPAPAPSPPIPTTPTPGGEGTGTEGTGLEWKGEAQPVAELSLVPVDLPAPAVRTKLDPAFDEFWQAFPVKKGKKPARQSWDRAIRAGIRPSVMIDGALRYRVELERNPTTSPKWAQGWITDERWNDEPSAPPRPVTKSERAISDMAEWAQQQEAAR